MSIKLGSNKSKASQTSAFERSPYITDTGYSTINGRSIRFDPSIRNIQDKALQNYASIYGDVGQSTDRFLNQSSDLRGRFTGQTEDLRGSYLAGQGDLRSRYLGNQGALVQSRLRPVQEQFGALRGQVQQNLGRRGLSGSSFQNQALTDIDRQRAFAEGDVRAQATQEALGFESQMNQSDFGNLNTLMQQTAQLESTLNAQELQALNQQAASRAQLTGESLEITKARLLQEMGAFGLGQRGTESATASSRGTSFGADINVLPKDFSLFK